MELKFKKIVWTQHSLIKLKQYGLSKTKIINIVHKPDRVEDGIVSGTVAMMRTNRTLLKTQRASQDKKLNLKFGKWNKRPEFKKAPGEIWLMYKDAKDCRKMISCWRYPGITKPGELVPIPEDIKNYIKNLNYE